jgi:hypothetical protein
MKPLLPLAAALLTVAATAACRDEPSVAEKFNTIKGEVENKARDYEAGAENLVAEQERRLAEEANVFLQQNANLLGNEIEVDVNSGEVAADPPR